MQALTYLVAMSLDAKIAREDGDFSCFDLQGPHVDWLFREWSDTLPGPALQATGTAPAGRFGTVLMGWNTYAVGLEQGLTSPYPHLRQVVFSRTRTSPDPGVEVTDADPAAFVRDLKAQDGPGIWLCGGGTLAGALLPQIDRLVLKISPFVLGRGIPLFAGAPDALSRFTRADPVVFDNGVTVLDLTRRT